MSKIIFIVMFGFSFNLFNAQNMKEDEVIQIETSEYLMDYIESKGYDLERFKYTLPTNGAYVYKLRKEKQIIVLPNGYGLEEKGFILNHEKTLKKFIAEDYFPIETNAKYLLENYNDFFKNFESEKSKALQELGVKLEMDLSAVSFFDDKLLENIDAKLISLKIRENKDELYVPLIVLLGEILIKNYGGSWQFEKRYGVYNPYFYPKQIIAGKDINTAHFISSQIETDSTMEFSIKFAVELCEEALKG